MQTLNHQIKRRKERIRVTDMGNKAIPMIKSYDHGASVGDTFVRDLVDLGKQVLISAALRAQEKVLSE